MSPLGTEPAHVLALVALLVARLLPLAWLLSRRASWPVALALTGALALCLYTPAAAAAPALPAAGLPLLLAGVRELLIGVLYALWLLLPLLALSWAGLLSATPLGVRGVESSLGLLYGALTAAGFFTLGGHRVALRALGAHLTQAPLGALDTELGLAAAAFGSVRLVAEALEVALALALPALAGLLLAELALALIARGSGLALGGSAHALRPLLWLWLLSTSLTLALRLLPERLAAALRSAPF